MSLKKYLLASGLSTVLLLGACGGVDTSTEEEPVEEETSEEASEDTENNESNEEETDGSSEDTQALEEENEELKTQNQELQDQIATLEEEIAEAQESTEEVNAEETNVDEESSESSNEATGENENLKTASEGETLTLDTVEMTVDAAEVNRNIPNEMDETMIINQEVTAGEPTDVIVIQYTVENTSEDPRTFFLDQAEIVTSNGHQLQSELLMSEGLQSEMHGAVSNTGTVLYVLPDDSGEEVEWVDVVVPTVSDNDFNFYTDEQNHRIEFE